MSKVRLTQPINTQFMSKNVTTYEFGNACQYKNGEWLCRCKDNGCRHKVLCNSKCKYQHGVHCVSSRAMADAYNLLQQRLEYVTTETRFNLYDKYNRRSSSELSYFDWLRKTKAVGVYFKNEVYKTIR